MRVLLAKACTGVLMVLAFVAPLALLAFVAKLATPVASPSIGTGAPRERFRSRSSSRIGHSPLARYRGDRRSGCSPRMAA